MIDEEDIDFIKVFLIIMRGGTFLCRKLLLDLVSQNGKSLENILQGHRNTLAEHLAKVQLKKLFPGNNQAIDINQWDISLLTSVLLNVFSVSLDSPKLAAVEALRDTRNNIVAHRSDSKITKDEFKCIWPHVTMAMRQLARTLASDDEMEYIKIESKIYSQPFETATVEELEEIQLIDTLTQSVVDSIMPKVLEKITTKSDAYHRRKNEELLRRLDQVEKRQVEQGKIQVEQCKRQVEQGNIQAEQGNTQNEQGRKIAILAKMQAKTGSAGTDRQVQERIIDASKRSICKDPEDEVETAIGDLFKGIEEIGVKVIDVEEGSILLTILCPSATCLRDIIVYIKSPQIKHKLTQIEKAVDKYHACETKITIDIDFPSLEKAIDTIEEKLDVGAVYLTLECNGTWGVKNAFQIFENGESTNTLNKLSEALSHSVGKKVELHTCIDKDKLEDDIEKEKERKDFERKKHEEVRMIKVRLLEDLEIMRKSDERSQQLLEEHFKMETDRKKEEYENNLMEIQYFQTVSNEEIWKENKEDLRRVIELQRMVVVPQRKMGTNLERSQQLLDNICESSMPGDEFYTQLKENESVIRRLDKELDRTRDELELLQKRSIHRQRRRLQEDLDKMRKSGKRTQQILYENICMEGERKLEDERNMREIHVFRRHIYEEMRKENKEDLRRLIEVQRMVVESQGNMWKTLRRSQQLLNNLCESNLPGYELFTQLNENEEVIRRLNKELDKTRNELNCLQKRAIHRERRRHQNAGFDPTLVGAAIGGAIGLVGGPVGLYVGATYGFLIGGLFPFIGMLLLQLVEQLI